MQMMRYQFCIAALMSLNLSCSTVGIAAFTEDNIRDVASRRSGSLSDAPPVVKNWLGILPDSNYEAENITYSIDTNSHDAVIEIQVDDELQTSSPETLTFEPITMFIDKSIHNHRLGRYYRQLIHKAAEIWENSVEVDLFNILDDDQSLTRDRLYTRVWSKILKIKPINELLKKGGDRREQYYDTNEPRGTTNGSPSLDGKSGIYYVHGESDNSLGYVFPMLISPTPAGQHLFTLFKINFRSIILEVDIVLNAPRLEKTLYCPRSFQGSGINRLFGDSSLNIYNLSSSDRCILAKFLTVIAHELGHALGLKHNMNNKNSIMHTKDFIRNRLKRADLISSGRLIQEDIDTFNESSEKYR